MDLRDYSVDVILQKDIDPLLDYWYNSTPQHFLKMGADKSKLPSRDDFETKLNRQLELPMHEKKSFAVIWKYRDTPIGHSNLNPMRFLEYGYMHLHLWNTNQRQKGIGSYLVIKSLEIYFDQAKLHTVFCEPFAENDAPNKTLQKSGFEFVKKHRTIPGALNFEQEVNLWKLEYNSFKTILK